MAISKDSSVSANASLTAMSSESMSLLEQAKKYKAMMDGLPPEDPNRAVYEKIIRDLLERSKRMSSFVFTTSSSS